MPIYEYACRACGVQREVMQKVSESPLTHCPACGAEAFEKKVSAAGLPAQGRWLVRDRFSRWFPQGSGWHGHVGAMRLRRPAPASTPAGGDSTPSTPAPAAVAASVD